MTRTQILYKQKQRWTRRADRIYKFFVVLVILIFAVMYIDFLRFPECYVTTWKYQLKNEIAAGEQEAITYYNTHYIKYNRNLFE